RDFDNRAQYAGAVDQAMLAVEGVAIGIAQRDDFFLPAVGVDAENLVDGLIAYVEEPGGIPHRAFGEAEIARNLFQLRIAIDEIPEFRRQGLQFELAFYLCERERAKQVEKGKKNSRDFHSHEFSVVVLLALEPLFMMKLTRSLSSVGLRRSP